MSLVEKVYRDYGDFILEVRQWQLLDDGVTVLWGPSGSGKSSLVRCLLGLDPQAQVSWRFGDKDIGELPVEQRHLGVVFQEPALFPHMTAKSNILFPLKKRSEESTELFSLLVDKMELREHLAKPVAHLSGGQQQRVAIARALIYRPRLLMMDEPFAALDEEVRHKTRDLVKNLLVSLRIPLLLITHDRQDVDELATAVSTMKNGRIASQLSVAQFRQNC